MSSSDPKSKSQNQSAGQEMWGGRFAAKPTETMARINASIDVDRRLWREDIEGSKAHATMLAAAKIITHDDNQAIQAGLDEIAGEIEAGTFAFSTALEDIHLNIEARLTERIGEAGKRLHTARSRNDQVATDFKLWTGRACEAAGEAVAALQKALVARAADHADTVMPGFTHLQTAQPVTLGHHLLAYVEMLERDQMRLLGASGAALEGCPLGAAALAGTGFAIDRKATAESLGFAEPMANSMDAVGSRDFALQALSALSIAGVTLSRLAEELVLWTSPQFGFARLSDAWSTGSSIMPQKRNPDAAELIRAKTKRISANASALTAIMAGLPLTYSKDMQDDKVITFEAFDAFELCVGAMLGMIETVTFNTEAMRASADRGFSTATDLADWLVRALNMPFREAHHVTGAAVKRAETLGLTSLKDLPLAELQAIEPRITEDARALLDVAASVKSRASFGGTAPDQVRAQVKRWTAHFEEQGE